ncbi:MAG: hypothetical protein IPL84_03605 [Chitinophagaceae bacterium]|nr:hypothetical protein [Chitinophagaceae bacterium]
METRPVPPIVTAIQEPVHAACIVTGTSKSRASSGCYRYEYCSTGNNFAGTAEIDIAKGTITCFIKIDLKKLPTGEFFFTFVSSYLFAVFFEQLFTFTFTLQVL